jgi:hypothetical protein
MQWKPAIRKEPAANHRYGKDTSRRGGIVYAAYDGDKLFCIAATASEARRLYREAVWAEVRARSAAHLAEITKGWRGG